MISGELYGNYDLTIVNFTLLEINNAAAWAQDFGCFPEHRKLNEHSEG